MTAHRRPARRDPPERTADRGHHRPGAAPARGTTAARSRCCWCCPAPCSGCSTCCGRTCPPCPGQPGIFDRVGLTMLGIFPFVVMFLVTSIAMLRERTSGTLERLLTTPAGPAGPAARLRRRVRAGRRRPGAGHRRRRDDGLRPRRRRLDLAGRAHRRRRRRARRRARACWPARSPAREFQAVQFMPVVVLPQFFLCGLLVPVRPDGRLAAGDQPRAAADLRGRGPAGGRRARPRPRARCGSTSAIVAGVRAAGPGAGRRHAAAEDPLSAVPSRAAGPPPRQPRHPGRRPGRRPGRVRRARLRRRHDPRRSRRRPGSTPRSCTTTSAARTSCSSPPSRRRPTPPTCCPRCWPPAADELGAAVVRLLLQVWDGPMRPAGPGAGALGRRQRVDGEAAARVPGDPGAAPGGGHARPARRPSARPAAALVASPADRRWSWPATCCGSSRWRRRPPEWLVAADRPDRAALPHRRRRAALTRRPSAGRAGELPALRDQPAGGVPDPVVLVDPAAGDLAGARLDQAPARAPGSARTSTCSCTVGAQPHMPIDQLGRAAGRRRTAAARRGRPERRRPAAPSRASPARPTGRPAPTRRSTGRAGCRRSSPEPHLRTGAAALAVRVGEALVDRRDRRASARRSRPRSSPSVAVVTWTERVGPSGVGEQRPCECASVRPAVPGVTVSVDRAPGRSRAGSWPTAPPGAGCGLSSTAARAATASR